MAGRGLRGEERTDEKTRRENGRFNDSRAGFKIVGQGCENQFEILSDPANNLCRVSDLSVTWFCFDVSKSDIFI